MANYDAGHYFLTMFTPVLTDGFVDVDGARRSHVQSIREKLMMMPTARQDPPSERSQFNSPFARVPGTHFARFFVVDQLRYNGRRPSNAIFDLVVRKSLTIPEKIDKLRSPYLVLCIDFDAADGDDACLRAYTDGMWDNMQDVLVDLFQHCRRFDQVTDRDSWFDYVKACQITTAMPFNDYWTEVQKPGTHGWQILGACGGVAALGLMVARSTADPSWWILVWSLLAMLAVALAMILWWGTRPFPKAPDSDLPSVLKAIYTQQMFVGFSIDNLGADDQALYDAFGEFVDRHRPSDVDADRQPAGVLRSEWPGQ